MSAGDHNTEPVLRLTVMPEPTRDEAEALVAAIAVYLAARPSEPETEPAAPSRWIAAGRRAAMRGLRGGAQLGWGRGGVD